VFRIKRLSTPGVSLTQMPEAFYLQVAYGNDAEARTSVLNDDQTKSQSHHDAGPDNRPGAAPESSPKAVCGGLLLHHPVSLAGLGPVVCEGPAGRRCRAGSRHRRCRRATLKPSGAVAGNQSAGSSPGETSYFANRFGSTSRTRRASPFCSKMMTR